MEQEEKEKLLLKDLSSRLPYGVMIHLGDNEIEELYCLNIPQEALYTRNKEHKNVSSLCPIGQCKPYLRPMSRVSELISAKEWSSLGGIDLIDWYNANHIDYRGLIENELALEAPEGMYKFE